LARDKIGGLEFPRDSRAEGIGEDFDEEGFEEIFLEVYLHDLVEWVGRVLRVSALHKAFAMNL